MPNTVVSIENVSKKYQLGAIGASSLNEELARRWARLRGREDPNSPLKLKSNRRPAEGEFWAVKDVTLQIRDGDVLGLIGRNGAGKSTLLKLISQVTSPTSGRIRIRGRVASLLEVGTGFHPDLSGRENILLNGAILGMTTREIRAKFDEIVDFSECEAFIDTPVKRYSSGMYVRLAFAIAAHLDPEILIVDEVLAVGDAQFQRKCLGKMGDASRNGRTILFVSHSMSAVTALCSRAIILQEGRIAFEGDVGSAVAQYQRQSSISVDSGVALADLPRIGTGKGRFTDLVIEAKGDRGETLDVPVYGCELVVRTTIACAEPFKPANVGVEIYDSTGSRLIDVNTALQGTFVSLTAGQTATVTFCLNDVLLKPGRYRVNLRLGRSRVENIDYVEFAGGFDFFELPSVSKHTEVFPGVYQCRFTHGVSVHADTSSNVPV